jgi:diketogulonate reductase-like aldo/keto reductase
MAAVQPVATSMKSTVTLNDGVVMPMFGLGCYLSEPGSPTENAVTFALQNGYVMVDTAQFYKNEQDVGKGIRNSGVKREDVFVVTKVIGNCHGRELTTKTVHDSLSKLGLSYIDLYLIHSPLGGKNVETFQALLDCKAKGLIRSVGVSNFGVQHLEGLQKAGLPRPSVNQIELHAFQRKADIVDYCVKNRIGVMGYSPIAQAKKHDDPDLQRIAKRLDKSVAQVLIRWSVQRGFITIPKSTKPERILENGRVFDFELSPDDMAVLNAKPEESVAWNPTVSPWEG